MTGGGCEVDGGWEVRNAATTTSHPGGCEMGGRGEEGDVKAGFRGGRDAQEAVDSEAWVWQQESRLV